MQKNYELKSYNYMGDFPYGDSDVYLHDRSNNRIYTWERVEPNGKDMFVEVQIVTTKVEKFDSAFGEPNVTHQDTLYIDTRKGEVFVSLKGYGLWKMCLYTQVKSDKKQTFELLIFHTEDQFPKHGMEGFVYMSENKIPRKWIPNPSTTYDPDDQPGCYIVDDNYDSVVKPDAGALARDKLVKRKLTLAQKFRRMMLVFVLLLITFIATIGYIGYDAWKERSVEWRVDYHMCYVKLGNSIIEGRRKYRYKSNSFLGFNYHDSESVQETTEILRSGLAFRISGQNEEGPWVHVNNNDSRETTELKTTDRYVFISAHDVEVVQYAEFCGKPEPME